MVEISTKLFRVWLEDRLQPGDLILSASENKGSKVIRFATRQGFSHAILSIGGGRLLESVEGPFTVNEGDGGVQLITHGELIDRWPDLRFVTVLRPIDLDLDRFMAAAEKVIAEPRPYPTVGLLTIRTCRWSTRMLERVWDHDNAQYQTPTSRWLHGVSKRVVYRQLSFVGDGSRRVHCAELAHWLYTEANLPIVYHDAFFAAAIRILQRTKASRQPNPTSPSNSQKVEGGGEAPASTSRLMSMRSAHELMNALKTRRRERTAPEVGDFVTPGDFLTAEPFYRVGSLSLADRGSRLW